MRGNLFFLIMAFVVLLILGYFYRQSRAQQTGSALGIAVTPTILPRQQCVYHGQPGSQHQHASLHIYLDDKLATIPAEIGIHRERNCMMAVHTHDDSGIIHLESPLRHPFTLADFFANWGQPFSAHAILDKKIDSQHEITMTVDGKLNTSYENLTLQDHQQIEIRYRRK